MLRRYELTDQEWEQVVSLLPPERPENQDDLQRITVPVLYNQVDSSPIFSSGTWNFTCTCHFSAGEADFGTFEFRSSFGRFRAIPAYGMSFPAYGDAVTVYGEVIFVYRRPSPVGIEVNEGDDSLVTAVFIVRHGIVCGVYAELFAPRFGQKLFQGEPQL